MTRDRVLLLDSGQRPLADVAFSEPSAEGEFLVTGARKVIEQMFELLEAPTNSPEPGGLPPGLDAEVPGPALALAVAGIDRDRLSGEERVALLRARSRLRAHVEAQLIADIVAIFDAEVEEVGDVVGVDAVPRLAAAEIQAALTWTRRAAEFQVDFAWTLVELYPQVWEALDAGLIDLPKARVICNQTIHLDPETRNQVVEIALERAPTQTTGLLAARIRRLAIWVDPESAKRRYEGGLEERRVVSEANDDGTANLWGLNMSPAETQAAMRRINRLARGLKAIGDHRTMDQIRADVFLDLIRGRPAAEGTDRAVVDINVDLTTLAGSPRLPARSPGSVRSSPMSPDRWSMNSTTPSGGTPRPTSRGRWCPPGRPVVGRTPR